MTLLQAASLSLPTSGSFDRVSAHYLLQGDRLRFERLHLEAPSVAMTGTGTLDWGPKTLDLVLVTRNPGMPRLGVVSEMVNVFKDQLIAIEVQGTLSEPEARVVSLDGIRESWDEIFNADAAPPAQPKALPGNVSEQ